MAEGGIDSVFRCPSVHAGVAAEGPLAPERIAALVLQPDTAYLPTKFRQATLVDLLDRALDKGVVISADLVVSLAGVPLVGVNLRAAVAGMETMLRYGLMRDWDQHIRDWESKRVDQSEPALLANERTVLRMHGALWAARGIYRSWRPGHIYLTNRRLILFRAQPPGTLLDITLHSVKGYSVRKGTHFSGHERDLIYLTLRSGDAVCLHSDKHEDLLVAMATEVEGMGLSLVEETAAPSAAFAGEAAPLMAGETIKAEGKIWRRVPQLGILGDTWRPGSLYLSDSRLVWWCETDRQVQLEVPVGCLAGADVESMDLGGLVGERPVLTLRYCNSQVTGSSSMGDSPPPPVLQRRMRLRRKGGGIDSSPDAPAFTLGSCPSLAAGGAPPMRQSQSQGEATALLTGDGLWEWKQAIDALAQGTEACPRCGEVGPEERLPEQGCPRCDWTRRAQSAAPLQQQPAVVAGA